MKESRKQNKEVKNKSTHKLFGDSTHNFKDKDRSVLSHEAKRNKKPRKDIKAKSNGAKSVPKINMKLQRNLTNCQQFEDGDSIDEYFIFENRIFPVVNSDERRTINRYFWTTDGFGKENKYFKDSATTCTGFTKAVSMKEASVMTTNIIPPSTRQFGLQIKIPVETKNQETMASATLPKTTKSFQQILNQLQFLYLPNNKHFENMTVVQKQHYRQLFLTLASKLITEQKLSQPISQQIESQLSPRNISQYVAFEIQKRISQQVNCVDVEIEKGIPTNLLCILSYLSNLFCFIEVQYRQQLLRGLNTPYGYYNQERFSLLIAGKSLKRMERILPDSIYDELESQFFSEDDSLDADTVEYMHHHNKVIFDNLNDELNLFRPFFYCNGEPYPWFIPGKITFFSIGEDDIELVLEKAKVKILQSASLLCGVHCEPQEPFSKSSVNESSVLKEVREQRERKLIFSEIMSIDESVEIEDERTLLCMELSKYIEEWLMGDANEQIGQLVRGDSFYIPVFDFIDN